MQSPSQNEDEAQDQNEEDQSEKGACGCAHPSVQSSSQLVVKHKTKMKEGAQEQNEGESLDQNEDGSQNQNEEGAQDQNERRATDHWVKGHKTRMKKTDIKKTKTQKGHVHALTPLYRALASL